MISPLALLATSLSLSTDAFAAALARGSAHPGGRWHHAVKVGAVFGASEGLMCLGGWLAAHALARVIESVDHWIALIVLLVIGGRMIWNGATGEGDDANDDGAEIRRATPLGTLVTAIGTSVDAAAVGVALALAGGPAWAALLVGATSFLVASLGYRLGPLVGERLGAWAEILGGVVLIGIGVSIFVSHTMG